MWRSWLRRQSGYPEVVGSNPAGGENWQLDELSQDRVLRDFLSLAMYFTPPFSSSGTLQRVSSISPFTIALQTDLSLVRFVNSVIFSFG